MPNKSEKRFDFIFEKIVYSKDKFFIYEGEHENGKTVKVVRITAENRSFEIPEHGQCFRLKGVWKEHIEPLNPYAISHQFHAESMTPIRITSRLTDRLLQRRRGIGPLKAQQILDRLGKDLHEVLTNRLHFQTLVDAIEPDCPGLGAAQAEILYRDFDASEKGNKRNCARLAFYQFIDKDLGVRINPRVANQIFSMLGEPETFDLLLANPYIAVGMAPWKSVDTFGRAVLKYKHEQQKKPIGEAEIRNHSERLLASVFSATTEILNTGDSWFKKEDALPLIGQLLNRTKKHIRVEPEKALNKALELGLVKDIGDGRLQHIGPSHMESSLAAFLRRSDNTPSHVSAPGGFVLGSFIKQAQSETGLTLTDEQDYVTREILKGNFNLLQGAAGTGKTTVMSVIVNVWKKLGGNVLMCALAGKAVLELTQSVKVETACTIAQLLHGLNKLAAEEESYSLTLLNGIESDVEYTIPHLEKTISGKTLVLIDEASMVDTIMLKNILNMIPPQVKLLLVGDHHQLPPIGWGQPFHDLVSHCTGRLNILTKVLRQGPESAIPQVAHIIKDGMLPDLDYWEGQAEGVYLIDEAEKPQGELTKQFGDDWFRVVALNDTVEKFNEENGPKIDIAKIVTGEERTSFIPDVKGGPLIVAGSKIICTRNRRSEGLFNGMLGVVQEIDGTKATVKWDCYEEPRELPSDAWFDVKPAYAITVHKSQGSSAKAVVVVLEDSRLLNRQWLYTAVTRARKLVLIQKPNSPAFENKINAHLSRNAARRTNFRPVFDALKGSRPKAA